LAQVFVLLISMTIIFSTTPEDVMHATNVAATTFFFVIVPINIIRMSDNLKSYIANKLLQIKFCSSIVFIISRKFGKSSVSPSSQI
jgi:hypothetical protein